MARITFSDIIGVIRKGQLPEYLQSGYDVPTSGGSGNEDGIAGHIEDEDIHQPGGQLIDESAMNNWFF